IHAAPTAEGVERVLLPGEREWANWRRALAEGIELPADVAAKWREAEALAGAGLPPCDSSS
ncbi:MAG: Ldh family oxidoreductase, partial [Gemmataceae bacterium]|nr:Ldh family oxidoreductase [Gemmataceae bacterium]